MMKMTKNNYKDDDWYNYGRDSTEGKDEEERTAPHRLIAQTVS